MLLGILSKGLCSIFERKQYRYSFSWLQQPDSFISDIRKASPHNQWLFWKDLGNYEPSHTLSPYKTSLYPKWQIVFENYYIWKLLKAYKKEQLYNL